MIQIEVDDLIFNNGVPDADGCLWYITKIEGWEMPDLRQSFHPITGYDGEVLGESALAGRTISLTGMVKTPGTEADYWLAYNKLLAKLNKRYTEAVFALHEGPTVKTLGVVLANKPNIENIGVGSFVFQFSLKAQYPIKLSNTEQSAVYNGSIAVVNGGSHQTWPVIVMTAAGAPVFRNTSVGTSGVSVQFTSSLPIGTVINFRKKTVLGPTGTDYYHLLHTVNDDWWPLMPGTNNLTRGGTGNATIYWRDAWL